MNAKRACSILVALTVLLPSVSWAKQALCASNTMSLQAVRNLALHGDVCAEFELGIAYANGKGVSQDDKQAAAWLRKAGLTRLC